MGKFGQVGVSDFAAANTPTNGNTAGIMANVHPCPLDTQGPSSKSSLRNFTLTPTAADLANLPAWALRHPILPPDRWKPYPRMKHILIVLLALASRQVHAAVTVDFEGDGPLPMVYFGKGPGYTTIPDKGISSSKAVVLANIGASYLPRPSSDPSPVGSFAASAKFTVGIFFKMSAFPDAQSTKSPGVKSQVLWLGLVDGTQGFTGLPFASVQFKDSAGAATLRIKANGPQSEVFTLLLNQWYYFEASFTRLPKDSNTQSSGGVEYELLLRETTPEGLLGKQVGAFKTTLGNTPATHKMHYEAKLNGPVFPGFKGHEGLANGAEGVIDNFFADHN